MADSLVPPAERPFPPLVEEVRPFLAGWETPVHLVGGTMRDALLGLPNHDLDYAVPDGAIALAYRLADAMGLSAYAMDVERDVGRIVLPDGKTTIDIARYRGPDLEADLRGRDFTINALALPATAGDLSQVIDLFGGLADLSSGQIRIVQPDAIDHDPIRALRAVRFGRQLGFELTPDTAEAASRAVPRLDQVSQERIREEMTRLLRLDMPQVGLRQLHELGLLAAVFPEVAALADVVQSAPHFEAVLPHTLRVLGYLTAIEGYTREGPAPDEDLEALLAAYREQLVIHFDQRFDGGVDGWLLLRLGAVWHDAGKLPTQTVEPGGRIRFFGHDDVGADIAGRRLRRLTFSSEAAAHVQRTVGGHMRPLLLSAGNQLPSRRAVYRYFRDLGTAGLDVGLLSLADHLATYDGIGDAARWARLLEITDRLFAAYFLERDQVVAPPKVVTGSELIAALDLTPGPEVGRLLKLIEEAQAAGDIVSRDQAIAFARTRRTPLR